MNKAVIRITVCILLPLLALQLRSVDSPLPMYYSAPDYQAELSARQDELAEKVKTLEEQLTDIDAIVKDSQTSTSTKIMKLQEGMADERDRLYDLQQFLKIPFQMKKCECRILSAESKKELQQKIANVEISIASLESDLQQCTQDTCLKSEQIATSIQNMKSYLAHVKEIFYSECCRARIEFLEQIPTGLANLNHSVFKDNLQAENWYYGSTTEEEYRLKMFEVTTKFNTKNCPIETPYANFQQNTCHKCEKEGAMFNLGMRQCFFCPEPQHLNETTSLCEECPEKLIYNSEKKVCQKCPDKHFLNVSSGQCQQCDILKGEYFDQTDETCNKCLDGKGYDESIHQCRECNSSAAEFLNKDTLRCEFCAKGDYLNQETHMCQKCGNNAFFNRSLGICQVCDENSDYNDQTEQCQPCTAEEYFNNQQLKCAVCPVGTSYSEEKDKCVCPINTPVFNEQLQSCESCPPHEKWDDYFQKCINFNNIGLCPHEKPFYNTTVHECEPCPEGTEYNQQYYNCRPLRHHLSA